MMHQIVYVVLNHADEKIVSVTNEYEEAQRVAYIEQELHGVDSTEVSITPVLVDSMMGRGVNTCYNQEEVDEAMEYAFQLAADLEKEEEEEEEKEEYEDWGEEPDCNEIADLCWRLGKLLGDE